MSTLNRLLIASITIALAMLVGCGDRPVNPGQPEADGAAPGVTPKGNNNDAGPSTTPPTTPTVPLPECLVAIRVDICCAAAQPATAEEVSKDPCLVPYPMSYSKIPKSCQDKWPEWCDDVDCAESPPESRLVYKLPDGRCSYKDECLTDADCVLAVDVRRCCTCPEPYPKELIDTDPCVVPPGQAESPSPGCPDRCTDFVLCDGCPPPGSGPVPHCTLGDALSRCVSY